MRFILAIALASLSWGASAQETINPFHREQIRAAQRPATGPEGPREQALRRCFETAPPLTNPERGPYVRDCIIAVAKK